MHTLTIFLRLDTSLILWLIWNVYLFTIYLVTIDNRLGSKLTVYKIYIRPCDKIDNCDIFTDDIW